MEEMRMEKIRGVTKKVREIEINGVKHKKLNNVISALFKISNRILEQR